MSVLPRRAVVIPLFKQFLFRTMASTSNQNEPKISLKFAQEDGEFRRQQTTFRNTIPSEAFPAESGRYHLYVSYACPWAHRTLIMRKLRRLESAISFSYVHYLLDENGWHFEVDPKDPEHSVDPVNGFGLLRQLYLQSNPDYKGRFTVPVLYDKKTKTIVNNESAEIIRIFNSVPFDSQSEVQTIPGIPKDLYPEKLRKQIDELNEWIYDGINNGVYKTGFATKQEVYEKHCRHLFECLDKCENIFKSGKKFLLGDEFTEADVRLFPSLLRFDPVYVGHFKCNLKTIEFGYPYILNYLRRVYQLPGMRETVNLEHAKKHYYISHTQINPNRIYPLGDGPDLDAPVKDL